jgi:protein-L-isoaspartate O-methyltransferase
LKNGGRLVVPVGKPGYQDFFVIDKDENGKITSKKSIGVTYIPLTSVSK